MIQSACWGGGKGETLRDADTGCRSSVLKLLAFIGVVLHIIKMLFAVNLPLSSMS